MGKIIAQGAEAFIERSGQNIIKKRISKGYRYPELDEKLRRLRTRTEARLIEKALQHITVPAIRATNEQTKELVIEYVAGKKVAEILDKTKKLQAYAKQIGKSVAKLHDANIIHGDLTTSNMLVKGSTIYFIDFGLGFQSARIEDKAVDLHVLKEALEARHPKVWQRVWNQILKSYKSSKHYKETITRLNKVEQRGRYKNQY